MLSSSTLRFLEALRKNNNREWFEKNRSQYEAATSDFREFVRKTIAELGKMNKTLAALEPKDCIFRIYRDVRFSKDKKPYKAHFGAYFVPGGKKSPLAGYYLHIEPGGKSFLGGGVYMPESANLFKIRQEILYNAEPFKKIISGKSFKHYFGELWGDKLKTPPRNFPKEHKDIELLKFKSYIAFHDLSDSRILSKDFGTYILKIFREMEPFNAFINRALD